MEKTNLRYKSLTSITLVIVIFAATVMLIMSAGCEIKNLTGQSIKDSEKKGIDANEEVKIGIVAPLSGGAAAYGIAMKDAIVFAARNMQTNLKIKYIVEDGKCDAAASIQAANKLIHVDKVKVIIGGLCSTETLAIAPIAEENKVILFSAGSGSPDITQAGDYIFRNFPSDSSSGKAMADYAAKNNFSVAVLNEITDYAVALKDVFVNRMHEINGRLTVLESYNTKDTDVRTQLTKIKANNPDAVYIIPQTPENFDLILQQFKELDLKAKILTVEGAAAEDILAANKNIMDGAVLAAPKFDESNPKAKAFFDKNEAENGFDAGALTKVYFAAAKDATELIAEAIQNAGYDSDKIRDYLYNIKDWEGAAGLLNFDENGDPMTEFTLYKIRNGQTVEMQS